MTASTVVVTDVTSSRDFVETLRYVVRTAPGSTEVVGVSSRFPALDARLLRRVRRVRVRLREEVAEAARAAVRADRLSVVVGSDCLLSSGWWAEVERTAAQRPGSVTDIGGGGTHVLVHPAGAAPVERRPVTISASLIVKDEEAVLAECLAAIAPFVDETVVYDTGSSDRTVEVARDAGATVVEGYWNDHFADARNRALEHCSGDWVIHVDADEVASGDPEALRAQLEVETADLLRVEVTSTTWSGAEAGVRSRSMRVFRREPSRWVGALHEFVESHRPDQPLVLSPQLAELRLLHSGYQSTTMHEKDKLNRNLQVSRAAVDALAPEARDADVVWSNYGRTLMGLQRWAEALVAFDEVATRARNSSAVVPAGRSALRCLEVLRRFEEAERWWLLLAEHGESAGSIALSRARMALSSGDPAAAERHLAAVTPDPDLWGMSVDPADVEQVRADLDAAHGHPADALRRLVSLLAADPESVALTHLLSAAARADAPLAEVVRGVGQRFRDKSLRDAMQLPVDQACEWLLALHQLDPSAPGPVVAGSIAAARASLATAVSWTVAARTLGITDPCALSAYAENGARPAEERCLAWAILADAFGEDAAAWRLRQEVAGMPSWQVPGLMAGLRQVAPGALALLPDGLVTA